MENGILSQSLHFFLSIRTALGERISCVTVEWRLILFLFAVFDTVSYPNFHV